MNKKKFWKKSMLIASAALAGTGASNFSMIHADLPTSQIITTNIFALLLLGLTIPLTLLYTVKTYKERDGLSHSEKILQERNDARLDLLKDTMIKVLKWGTIPAVGIAVVMMYDAFSQPTIIEKAAVIEKHLNWDKGAYGHILTQNIETKKAEDNDIHRSLYDAVQPGDTLIIHKSSRMELWELVELYHNDKQVASFTYAQTNGVIIIILLFFTPLLSFFLSADKPMRQWVQNYQMGIWISAPIIELASLGLWFMFFLI